MQLSRIGPLQEHFVDGASLVVHGSLRLGRYGHMAADGLNERPSNLARRIGNSVSWFFFPLFRWRLGWAGCTARQALAFYGPWLARGLVGWPQD